MSPQGIGISTTYKTRVALENPCRKRQGIVIGQLKDSDTSAIFAVAVVWWILRKVRHLFLIV